MFAQLLSLTWQNFKFNHMQGKVWDETTYPFPNFNACTIEDYE